MFHRHRWSAVSVQPGQLVFPEVAGTRVLIRCTRCGRHRVEVLQGNWSLQELADRAGVALPRRIPDQASALIRELAQAMARAAR